MTFINMLTWWQWLALAAVPPTIVLLYFLKLKRTPLEVPSTLLWQKSIEDLHVNSIWQRLRSSLLLFLQLLLLLLAMIALVRPGWSGSRLEGNRYVFMIDNSASMQARDVAPSRLQEAKRRAGELIDQMRSGDVAMIVSFSDTPRVEQVFTDDRRELKRQLDAIRPTKRRTSIEEAIRVAAGFAVAQNSSGHGSGSSTTQSATMYLFSDGGFPDVTNAELGRLKPVFIPIGQPTAENIAITSFTTRHREDDESKLQAFGRVQNLGAVKRNVDLELYLDEVLLDSARLEIEPRDSQSVVFELGEIASGVLRLATRTGGDLSVDDQAWTAVDPPRRSRVLLITAGNQALELAATTASAKEIAEVDVESPAVLQTEDYRKRAEAGYWSLVIYDNCAPSEMPQANTFFIGHLPPVDSWRARTGSPEPSPQIIDVEIAHPLMQLIDLGNVRFVEGQTLIPPPGGSSLITTSAGPLLAIAPRGTWQDAVLGAALAGTDENGDRFANTDWPLRVSFPVFILNALRFLTGGEGAGTALSIQPGQPIALPGAAGGATMTVRTPNGQTIEIPPDAERRQFSETTQVGPYLIEEPGHSTRHFAVNLFDSAESDLSVRDEIQLGFDDVAGQANWEGGRTELWRWLLVSVLGVLCLEWYIYNRRVYL
jgi:hypothetical protein